MNLNEEMTTAAIRRLERNCRDLKEEVKESKNIIKKFLLKRKLKQKEEKLEDYRDTLKFIKNGYKED